MTHRPIDSETADPSEAGGVVSRFARIDTFVFDLDNTLYRHPRTSGPRSTIASRCS